MEWEESLVLGLRMAPSPHLYSHSPPRPARATRGHRPAWCSPAAPIPTCTLAADHKQNLPLVPPNTGATTCKPFGMSTWDATRMPSPSSVLSPSSPGSGAEHTLPLPTPERPFPRADASGDGGCPGLASGVGWWWPGGLSPLRAASGWSFAAHVAAELMH